MRRKTILIVALLAGCLLAQENSVKRRASIIGAEQGPSPHRGRQLFVVIGINDYLYWPHLDNPENDARELAHLLRSKLNFLEISQPVLGPAAKREALVALFDHRLRTLLRPDDELLLFFAGHGLTRTDTVGDQKIETGYIVPADARLENAGHFEDFIRIDDLLETISLLPARHILVILDSCYSGLALGSGTSRSRSLQRYTNDLVRRVSRKVIVSARADQTAADSGPVPQLSLFTGTLIRGVNDGSADLDKDGQLTSSEMGLYLQQQVGQASASAQTPDFGAFDHDNRGELVISLGKHNVTPPSFTPTATAEEQSIAVALSAQSKTLQATNPSLINTALLLAAESVTQYPTAGGSLALEQAGRLLRPPLGRTSVSGTIRSVQLAPQGDRVVVISDKEVATLELPTLKPLAHREPLLPGAATQWLPGRDVFVTVSGTAVTVGSPNGAIKATMASSDAIEAFALSPDEEHLVGLTKGPQVSLWELTTGRLLRTVHIGHGVHDLHEVLYSRSGDTIVIGGVEGQSVWDKLLTHEIGWHSGEAGAPAILGTQVLFTPSITGKQLFIAYHSKLSLPLQHESREIWNVGTNSTTQIGNDSPFELGKTTVAEFSPDDKWLVTGKDNGTVEFWNAQNSEAVLTVQQQGEISSLAFSADGKRLLTGSMDSTAREWGVLPLPGKYTLIELARIPHSDRVSRVAFNPKGDSFVSVDARSTLYSWMDIDPRDEETRLKWSEYGQLRLKAVEFLPDDNTVLIKGGDGRLREWRRSVDEARTRPIGNSETLYLASSRDGNFGLTSGDSNRVVTLPLGTEVVTLSDYRPQVAAFSGDGRAIALAHENIIDVFWRLPSLEHREFRNPFRVQHLETASGGNLVVACDQEGMTIWSRATGKIVTRATYPRGIRFARFSKDERQLALGGEDGIAILWDLAAKKEIHRFVHGVGSVPAVVSAKLNEDGTLLLTVTTDNIVRIWDVSEGRVIYASALEGSVDDAALDRTSRSLAFLEDIGGNSILRVRKWWATDLVQSACGHGAFNISRNTWTEYFPASVPFRETCSTSVKR